MVRPRFLRLCWGGGGGGGHKTTGIASPFRYQCVVTSFAKVCLKARLEEAVTVTFSMMSNLLKKIAKLCGNTGISLYQNSCIWKVPFVQNPRTEDKGQKTS